MNKLLKWAEPKFAVFALLIYSGFLNLTSYGLGIADKLVQLSRYGIYLVTILLILARFKTVIRPALRDPFLWALMALVTFSYLWSDFPAISKKEGILTLVASLFGLYMASRFTLKEQLQIVAWAAGIAAVFSLFYTLALPGYGKEQGFHAGAWRGPLIQKNMFARFMVIFAPPILMVALDNPKYRYALLTVFGITLALVQLSNSKSALLICITLMILLPLYSALRWSGSIVIPILIIAVLVSGSAATWLISNWEPFLYSLGKDPSLTGRTDIWIAVIDKVKERPWLGYGYAGFWVDGGVGERAIWKVLYLPVTQAHNGYINIVAELGLLGLLFFVLSMVTAYIRAINLARSAKTIEGLWPITYMTFILMYNQTESTNIETNSLLWILYVAVTLSIKSVRIVKPGEESENYGKEMISQTDLKDLPQSRT
ncbi:O-antigen ligase family protein [Argonema antarcticum]|uniref:O-antigen ligase family protein n=1 Tax=Argonema antarcticum TaxID=2942763 RepID=UPI0020126D9B|nr:O-antigen ligase [Argonema antarcticum]MCL1472414.1 O-antigen ligase family protein [Argonema antarcticum A004/B2]